MAKKNELEDMILNHVEPYLSSVEGVTETGKDEAKNMLHGLVSLAEQRVSSTIKQCKSLISNATAHYTDF